MNDDIILNKESYIETIIIDNIELKPNSSTRIDGMFFLAIHNKHLGEIMCIK